MLVASWCDTVAFSCCEHVCLQPLAGFKKPVRGEGRLVRLELREPTQHVLSLASVLLAWSLQFTLLQCFASWLSMCKGCLESVEWNSGME